MAHCAGSQESLQISGGAVPLPTGAGELSQAEIQSVLDSIFFSTSSSSLPLSSSLPSTVSQSSSSPLTTSEADLAQQEQQQCLVDEEPAGTRSSTQTKYATSTSSGRR